MGAGGLERERGKGGEGKERKGGGGFYLNEAVSAWIRTQRQRTRRRFFVFPERDGPFAASENREQGREEVVDGLAEGGGDLKNGGSTHEGSPPTGSPKVTPILDLLSKVNK